MRFLALLLAGCATTAPLAPTPDALIQIADAELADGFTIVFPDGTVQTRADVIGGLVPGALPSATPAHHAEDRTIRVLGETAILTGVYVNALDAFPLPWRARRRPSPRSSGTPSSL